MQVILSLIPLREGKDVVFRLILGHRQRGVDEHPVGGGDFIQHKLQSFSMSAKGSPPVNTKSHRGVMASIRRMLSHDLLQREACHVRILTLC